MVPFFEEPSVFQRMRGIVSRLQPNGFEVVLYNVDAPERARRLLMELPASGRVDGLIVITLPLRADEGERLAEAPFPTVLVDTWHPALPSVSIDDVAGGRLATSHLLDLGHERIAFIGEPPRNPLWFVASRLREQGYSEALLARRDSTCGPTTSSTEPTFGRRPARWPPSCSPSPNPPLRS